jgi:superfamily II DNA helicase RecQ
MKVRVFTLLLDPETGAFDDTALLSFQESRDIILVSEHFFTHEGSPRLALVVQYPDPAPTPAPRRPTDAAPPPRGQPEVEAPPEHRPLFSALRKWRNERAKRDGRPAYVLFTNAQLLAVATQRPANRTALQAIEGIGEARVRDYGDEVLRLVETIPVAPPAPMEAAHGGDAGAP